MLNPKQRRFLEWIRDNEHHVGSLVGEGKMRLRGTKQITVTADTLVGITSLYEPGDYDATKRMFVLTETGKEALSAP